MKRDMMAGSRSGGAMERGGGPSLPMQSQWMNHPSAPASAARPTSAVKRHLQQQRQQEADFLDKKVMASTYLSIGAFLVLACLTLSLLILPLVLPPLPLPPPPSLLLWLPVCLLLLLIVLAFMPTDVRTMASSYL